ncbi:Asp/Glu/hydantoin racemase [Arthrobacter sp. ISL-65]|uniref:maleate cis-trans isomerase family protein n=1 Tax=Arthrobacter sp. ISL-65 TaxID=2819112 RepID=UPI001BEBA64C|nr:Asp/Glu/hydantoin racemase [Arthrobacter sp. ISL-65]MBT2547779.1 Asp/Glu/hydantoin racemase [Arthrobacter sp. ISL-65]
MTLIPNPALAPAADPPGPQPWQDIGVVCPFDMALDHELWRWMPDGVNLVFTRTPYYDQPVGLDMAEEISDHGEIQDAVRSLVAIRPAVVTYACTSGSFVHGVEGARKLSAAMVQAGAPAAVTTSEGLLMALDALGVSRVAVATPYLAELTNRLTSFLEQGGKSVVSHEGLGLDRDIWTVPYATTCELIRQADRPEAEAVFVSCTNLPTYDLIAYMERELGKPVITANQVTAWSGLRLMGREAVGPDQLLLQAGVK